MKNDSDEKFSQRKDSLLEKIEKTAGARFSASIRFESHDAASQWLVAGMSCCVIGLTLYNALSMVDAECEQLVDFLQVFASVGVLAFSILQAKSNFAMRAYAHHQCGRDLKRLENNATAADSIQDLEKLSDQYDSILDKHENHSELDFLRMQLQSVKYHEHYRVDGWFRATYFLKLMWEFRLYLVFTLISLFFLACPFL